MRLLILGATGGTGRHAVAQAQQQGHKVTVLVRDPSRLGTSEGLRVITGRVTDDLQALTGAVDGQDAVISTLGVGKSFKSGGLITRSVPAILQAMEVRHVRRLIFTSAFGVGETWRDVPFLPRIFMRTLLRDVYADKEAGDTVLRRSSLDWTLVHPSTLTDGPRTGHYRKGERLTLSGVPHISRADVADFLLSQVADNTYLQKSVLISY